MSPLIQSLVLLLHLVAMLFMAAPLYALIAVNERAGMAVPPNYNTDRFLENMIKGQPIRCYAFLTVIIITGLLLTWYNGWIWTNGALIAKLVVTATILSLLSYGHFGIQPNIERILDKINPGEEVSSDDRPTLVKWRMRRKRLAGFCLFLVLTGLIMGVRASFSYTAWWLVVILMAAAALFAWRVYRNPVRLGWF